MDMDTIVSNSELSIFISFFYKRGMSPWTLCPCDDDTIGKRKMHHLLLTAVKETLKKKMRNNSASFWKEILCYIRRFVCHGHVKRHLIWSHDMQVWPPFFFLLSSTSIRIFMGKRNSAVSSNVLCKI